LLTTNKNHFDGTSEILSTICTQHNKYLVAAIPALEDVPAM